jgi:hypothetical protein
MYVPIWMLVVLLVLLLGTVLWLSLILAGRNPLPFPDGGSRISRPRLPPPRLRSSISSRGTVFRSAFR